MDEPDLLELFEQLVREEFGLTLPKPVESAVDEEIEAVFDAFSDVTIGERSTRASKPPLAK